MPGVIHCVFGDYLFLFENFSSMDLNEQFKSATERVHELDKRPSNEQLLQLYGLFKQATEGDVKEDRPGGFDFKAIAKYDTWANLKGKTQDEAKQDYINLVDSLFAS